MPYAENTQVSSEKSKMEIEQTLARYGASSFASGWQGQRAVITFEAHGRRIRFDLPLPSPEEKRFTHRGYSRRTLEQSRNAYDQEVRRLWRAMLLAIKAKLEVVESGIASFEEEFMAHIVLPNGATVGKWMTPQLHQAYTVGQMPPLLGSGQKD